MAERRMFAKTIIDSDAFLEMPLSTQALYFHLSMRADDDGFLNNAKKVMRMIGANQNDLDLLLVKNFVIKFEDGICVIKHWRIHNYIQTDRYHETMYKDNKNLLNIDENKAYTLKNTGKKLEGNRIIEVIEPMDTECIQDVSKMDTQVRLELGKDSIGKDSIEKKKEKKKKTSGLDEIINNYTSNLELKETLQDFLKMRKAQKKPMTDRALKTLLKKLDTLATTDEEKIERLEESICNCWLTVYPKKDFNNKNYKQESLDTKANKNYENLKKIMKEQQEHYEENVAKYMADCEEVPF